MKPQAEISLNDWLIAEAVRRHEERHGRIGDDEAAVEMARALGPDLSARIACRARALPGAPEWQQDLERLRSLARQLAIGLLILAAVSGFVAARASIAERQVDFLLAATALLFVPTALLIIWALIMLVGWREKRFGSLAGGVIGRLIGWLAPRLLTSPLANELALSGTAALSTRFGRWAVSAFSHVFWLVYALVALITLVVFFSVVQYDLTWGTTLLTESAVVSLVQTLAWLPSALSLMPPVEADWVLAGREGGLGELDRAVWARFLLSILLVYGLLPRLVLALVCAALAWRAASRMDLDLRRPGYLRLAADLNRAVTPEVRHGAPPPEERACRRQARHPNASHPVLIGLELDRAGSDWPPLVPGVAFDDGGLVATRADRKRILSALSQRRRPPAALIALCSMLRTPDAGHARFLAEAARQARAPLVLILDQAGALSERGGDVRSRLDDWQALAGRAGGDAVLLDLDRPEAAAIARLVGLVGSE